MLQSRCSNTATRSSARSVPDGDQGTQAAALTGETVEIGGVPDVTREEIKKQ